MNHWTACWLAYPLIREDAERPLTLASAFHGDVAFRAYEELSLGMEGLYRRDVSLALDPAADLRFVRDPDCHAEGYRIRAGGGRCVIESGGASGILYGVFALLRQLQIEQCTFAELEWTAEAAPDNPLRMFDHWDNLDGSIERGYAGRSFFFENNEVLVNERSAAYARLAASAGINAVVINNANVKDAALHLLTGRYDAPLRRLQTLFASYGIRLFLSVEFAAPTMTGALDTDDPCDERVRAWWKAAADRLWENVPGLGGFLIKADSEGRPGPYTYGRNHADGANMLAEAVAPHGGLILWRCFVYNCQQDWRDTKTDRAKASYSHYAPLDGQFRDNVVLQIKNGPMDFQVREPVSPLFSALKRTNMMLELQAAQEYTGQQIHVCYLIPWYREILSHDFTDGTTVASLVSGRAYRRPLGGIATIANTGSDANWTGHDLAAANLYGVGRLAYDTSLSSETIAAEWTRLTFGARPEAERVLADILLRSWRTYERYTVPLGIGWMCNPAIHYGPNPDGYEYSRWGTYHRADSRAIGVDRTKNGTGFTAQYPPALAARYDDPAACPEELLLFFHRLPYDYRLKSGKTLIQHIYDTHFEGAEEAAAFLEQFESIRDLLPADAYERMHARFLLQKDHAREWRDVINSYFLRKSGIDDEQGRKIYT